MPPLPYKLIRSAKRKTLAVSITKSAEIEVRAPLHYPTAQIERFLKSKESWILPRLQQTAQQWREKQSLALESPQALPFLGTDYPVLYTDASGKKVSFDHVRFILPGLPFDALKPSLAALYKKLLLPAVLPRVRYFAAVMGEMPTAVKVSAATKQWGSCSAKGVLNFSWMLALTDPDALDYVVVHELAHMKEMNHSVRFWAIVKNVLPDYPAEKKRLADYHEKLSLLF